MSYTSIITYPVYDLNSSLFLDLIAEILETEFTEQITTHGKTFLPTVVKKDEYLLNPVADKEINPAFCSIIKSEFASSELMLFNQQNNTTRYIIGILADGLLNLRKIADSIYEILNDMEVKNYIFLYEVEGMKIIANSSKFMVTSLSTDITVSKTMNNKNIIYGNLILEAELAEIPKYNTHATINQANLQLNLGEEETELKQTTNY